MSSPFAITDGRKIGIGLTAFGLAFTLLGVALLFDKGLLAMGNVLYLSGVMLIIGPTRSVRFFFQKRKAKASVFFFLGMAIVLFGLPMLGMGLEAFGFVNLFGDFFPVVIAFLRRAPVVGKLLVLPGVRNVRGYVSDLIFLLCFPSDLTLIRHHNIWRFATTLSLPPFWLLLRVRLIGGWSSGRDDS